jgi:hypothetical protein
MAKTLEEMIAELKGLAPIKGGVMSLLDTPANNEQETKRTQYLMDMFSGTNPETGDSFLEPTPKPDGVMKNEYMDEVSRAMAQQDAYLKSLNIGARGLNTPAERDAIMNSMVGNNLGTSARDLGFTSENEFQTPLQDNAQAVLSRLSEAELKDVMEILPQLTPAQYMAFIAGLEDGSINPSGYEVQNQYRLRM